MAKSLKDILKDKESVHSYRIKFAFEPHDEMIRSLEHFLNKYDLIKIGDVNKTIFQSKPMDFEHLDAGEIWMVDVELGRGMSSGIALQELAKHLFTSEDLIRIRGEFEPAQIEASIQEDDIELDEYIVKIDDPEYTDALQFEQSDIVGDEYSLSVAKDASETKSKYTEYMFASAGTPEKQVWTPPKRNK